MKTFLQKFRKNEDGVISVEFALIAPMLIFATLFAINLGYQVTKHQKLASSIAAGNNYLQDYVMNKDLADFRPNYDNENGKTSDNTPIATAKQVIMSAYGGELKLNEISIDTTCGCPNNSNAGGGGDDFGEAVEPGGNNDSGPDFTDPNTEIYNKTQMSLWKKGELCGFDCPENGGRARVIVEIRIDHILQDLFAKEIIVQEILKARMR